MNNDLILHSAPGRDRDWPSINLIVACMQEGEYAVIPNFPQPYEDELLYSVVARYCWSLRHKNPVTILQQIFGRPNVGISIDFPNRLSAIRLVYGPHSPWDVSRIVQKMTMLPFYAPFLPAKRLALLEKGLLGSADKSRMNRSGIIGNGILEHRLKIRYCPACASEERDRHGEAFWHRLPQLPGIHICPLHKAYFEDSNIPVPRGYQCTVLIPAEVGIPDATSPRRIDTNNKNDAVLLRIALSASWLASKTFCPNEFESLRERYLGLAMRHGYASGTSCIRWTKLLPDFRSRYSPELLARLHCSLPQLDHKICRLWLASLLWPGKSAQAPVRHLVMMDFLGLDAENYFKLDPGSAMFDDEPVKCDNPLCGMFDGDAIMNIRIEHSTAYKCPQRVITCPGCGQERLRIIVNGRTRERITKYGRVWIKVLTRAWQDPSISMVELSKTLGTDPRTIVRQAGKAGLPFPRHSPRGVTCKNPPAEHCKRKLLIDKERDRRRVEWSRIRSANPQYSMAELTARAKSCYTFLYRYDRDWLREKSPKRSKSNPPRARAKIDWNSRDRKLVDEVIHAIQALRDEQGLPKRITITAIGQKLSDLWIINKYSIKLPMTRETLMAGIESYCQFLFRKIAWAGAALRKEGRCINVTVLAARAKLSPSSLQNPKILEAIRLQIDGLSLEPLPLANS